MSKIVNNSGINHKPQAAIVAYALFTALLLIRFTAISKTLFVMMGFLLGIYLYSVNIGLYLVFTYSLWFFTAFIYRLGEYLAQDSSPGFYMFLPCVVTLICSHTYFKFLPKHFNKECLPFGLCLLSILYGFIIGIINQISFGSNIVALLQMSSPIFLSFFILMNWREYPQLRQTIRKTFLICTVLMCIYGIYQRIFIPEWDQYWIRNIDKLGELGADNSLVTGIFSTTTGRQQFAAILQACLVLAFCETRFLLTVVLSTLYFLTFLLTQARAAWFAFAISVFIFLASVKQNSQIKVIILFCISLLFLVFLASLDPFSSTISERLETFTSLEDDGSLLNRKSAYSALLGLALREVFGQGLGFNVSSIATTSNFDGSIFQMLLFIGWFGVFFLVLGFLRLLLKLFSKNYYSSDLFFSAARAISIGIFVQIGFNFIFIGPHAVVIWSFLGIALAEKQYSADRAYFDVYAN